MFHFWINTFFIDMHVLQQQAQFAEDSRYVICTCAKQWSYQKKLVNIKFGEIAKNCKCWQIGEFVNMWPCTLHIPNLGEFFSLVIDCHLAKFKPS